MLHPSKCEHGVYWPICDKKALYCRLCCPEGLEVRATKPKKTRKPQASTENGLSPLSSDNELEIAA